MFPLNLNLVRYRPGVSARKTVSTIIAHPPPIKPGPIPTPTLSVTSPITPADITTLLPRPSLRREVQLACHVLHRPRNRIILPSSQPLYDRMIDTAASSWRGATAMFRSMEDMGIVYLVFFSLPCRKRDGTVVSNWSRPIALCSRMKDMASRPFSSVHEGRGFDVNFRDLVRATEAIQ